MKKLLIFTPWPVGEEIDLTPESNLWYIQRYGEYFDEVTHIFLAGRRAVRVIRNGKMSYISLGSGNNKLDLLLSPYRLYKFAKAYEPSAYMTVEQVWLFWLVLLIKPLLGAKVYLMPIAYPEATYKVGQTLTAVLPIWLERWLISLSYRAADRVITSKNWGGYVEWISANPVLKNKMIAVDALPESIPATVFFDSLKEVEDEPDFRQRNGEFNLIYVGRLHHAKSVDHLIKMMALLKEQGVAVKLKVIGDGPERHSLESLSTEIGVKKMVDFLGWKSNSELPRYLKQSDAFVSTSTGGSLREAALCGLPVIAYDKDWIQGLLKDRETFLAVTPEDYSEMADKVVALINDEDLQNTLSNNLRSFAWANWSDTNIEKSLREIYG
jgi:glycosyltransferase involved in cell wall biosynthesis